MGTYSVNLFLKKTRINLGLVLLATLAMTQTSCNPDDGGDITPTETVPTDLTYDPASISGNVGTALMSSAPTIKGTTPITYSMTSTPDAAGEITIDANTGVISATNATGTGSFSISVKATNSAGSTDFADIFAVQVIKTITFTGDIQPLIQSNCAPCHVYGGTSTNYSQVYMNAKDNVDYILDRVQRTQGSMGFMPNGGTKLDDATISLIKEWKAGGLLEN